MTEPQPDIDVVVVTWQGRDLLHSCLEHLRAQTAPHRVIVVDNASDDGTAAMVAADFPEAHLIEMPSNVGFGQANNRGVDAGTAPYVVLVNNDVDAEPRFLEELVQPLRDDDACGAATALTLRPGDGRVDQFGITLDAGLCAYTRGVGQDPDDLHVGVLAAPCAGAASYRRTAFEQVDGFDPRFFAYSEDLDLGLRLHAAGWQFASAPAARGVHYGGATTSRDSDRKRRLGAFGRGFIVGRYAPPTRGGRLHGCVIDLAVCAFGLLRYRTVAQLTERLRGRRAAASSPQLPVASELIDRSISLRVALRRLASG